MSKSTEMVSLWFELKQNARGTRGMVRSGLFVESCSRFSRWLTLVLLLWQVVLGRSNNRYGSLFPVYEKQWFDQVECSLGSLEWALAERSIVLLDQVELRCLIEQPAEYDMQVVEMVLMESAKMFRDLGNRLKALKKLEKLVKLIAHDAGEVIWNDYIVLLMENGYYDQALDQAERYYRSREIKSKRFLFNVARVLHSHGKLEEAVELYSDAFCRGHAIPRKDLDQWITLSLLEELASLDVEMEMVNHYALLRMDQEIGLFRDGNAILQNLYLPRVEPIPSAITTSRKKLVLMINHFRSSNPQRNAEFQRCLEGNLANPWIDHVVLLVNGDAGMLEQLDKVVLIQIAEDRPSFGRFLEIAAASWFVSFDVLLIANNDILFGGESLQVLSSLPNKPTQVYNILRREGIEGTFYPRIDCQDAWVFQSFQMDKIASNLHIMDALKSIKQGQPGVDNRFTGIFTDNGFHVKNLGLFISMYHLHQETGREVTVEDHVHGRLQHTPLATKLL